MLILKKRTFKMERYLITIKSYSHAFHIVLNSIHHINNILNKTNFYIKKSIRNHKFLTSNKTFKTPYISSFNTIIYKNNFFLYLIHIYNFSCDLSKQTSILWVLKEDVKKLREKLLQSVFSLYFLIKY